MKRKLIQDDAFRTFVRTNPDISREFYRLVKKGKTRMDFVSIYRKLLLCNCSNNANRQALKGMLTDRMILQFFFDEFYNDVDSQQRRNLFKMIVRMAHTTTSTEFDRSVIPTFHYVNRYNCYCWVKKRIHPIKTLPKRTIRWMLRRVWVKIKPTRVGKIIDKIRGKNNDNCTS